MLRFKNLKTLIFLLYPLYFFFEYSYDYIVLSALLILQTVLISIKGVAFGKKVRQALKLGEVENFVSPYFVVLLFLLYGIVIFVAVSFLKDENVIGDIRDVNSFVAFLILVPSITEMILSYKYSDLRANLIFATDKGLIRTLQPKESFFWNDFRSYTFIEEYNLIRFKKKNLKYLVVSYDDDYFKEHKEKIVAFLDKKLTRE